MKKKKKKRGNVWDLFYPAISQAAVSRMPSNISVCVCGCVCIYIFGAFRCVAVGVCAHVCLKGCMWLLGLCCDTCKAGYKLLVTASASHKADGGEWLIFWRCGFLLSVRAFVCVCVCTRDTVHASVSAKSKSVWRQRSLIKHLHLCCLIHMNAGAFKSS